jgi:hypothetical protein
MGIYIKASESNQGRLHCHAFVTLLKQQIAKETKVKKLEHSERE